MPNASSFIAAIREAPDDDTPRLVFSDWLEDQGEIARAELIRVQCELARLPTFDLRYPELHLRQLELIAEHEREWLGEWAERLVRWEFRRGLLHSVTLTPGPFVQHGEELFRDHPVERVALVEGWGQSLKTEAIAEVVAAPAMGEVRALETAGSRREEPLAGMYGGVVATSAWLAALAGADHVVRLEELYLNGDTRSGRQAIDLKAWRCFCGARQLRTLRHLDLRDRYSNDESAHLTEVVRLLEKASFARTLRTLSLAGCRAEDEAARQLASARLDRLEVLDLAGCNHLGQSGLEAILGATSWPRLHTLAVTVGSAVESLASSPFLAQLNALHVTGPWRHPDDRNMAAFLQSPALQNLTEFSLRAHCRFAAETVAGLMREPWTSNLRALTLECEDLTAEHLAPLFARRVPGPTPLHSLTLLDCDDIGAALAAWPGLAGLTQLNLARMYDQECERDTDELLRSPHLSPRLCRLDLNGSCRTVANVERLACCPGLAGLRWLGFGWNSLDAERVRLLLQSPYLRHVESLHLSSEHGTDSAAEETMIALTGPATWPRLRDVVVGSQTPRDAIAILSQHFGARLRVWSDC
jgi:uncharacterized protein (TIGR02996 family)